MNDLSYYVGFVDAGYLKKAGADALRAKARDVSLDAQGTAEWFREMRAHPTLQAEHVAFLRVYWYDGAFDPRDERFATQRAFFDSIADVPGIHLRLGHISVNRSKWAYPVKRALEKCGVDLATFEQHFQFRPEMRQKGVDTRIVLDLLRLAQQDAYDTAVLIAGDRDLAEAVRAVQELGKRVIIVGTARQKPARELTQLADEVRLLGSADVRQMLTHRTPEIRPEDDGDDPSVDALDVPAI